MTLTQALNKLGKVVGKSKYKSVEVKITGFGKTSANLRKKEDTKIEWQVYAEGQKWTDDHPTFYSALKEMKQMIKPYKMRKQEDVNIKEVKNGGKILDQNREK